MIYVSLQVFLILREHMGDEVLDLAGGVLYELIEIDCPFSDDAGAGFQRWRWNHMRRGVSIRPPLPDRPNPSYLPTADFFRAERR